MIYFFHFAILKYYSDIQTWWRHDLNKIKTKWNRTNNTHTKKRNWQGKKYEKKTENQSYVCWPASQMRVGDFRVCNDEWVCEYIYEHVIVWGVIDVGGGGERGGWVVCRCVAETISNVLLETNSDVKRWGNAILCRLVFVKFWSRDLKGFFFSMLPFLDFAVCDVFHLYFTLSLPLNM